MPEKASSLPLTLWHQSHCNIDVTFVSDGSFLLAYRSAVINIKTYSDRVNKFHGAVHHG